jgi:hypothetical protein
MPTSPQARVTPKARSVINTVTAARLACGLTIFGAADSSRRLCRVPRRQATV